MPRVPLLDGFMEFWQAYPNRKAKLDAMKAYGQARKSASAADILAGVLRYVRGKPEYADWKLPAGWLRGGRWMDEYDVPLVKVYTPDYCQHEPRCHSRTWHEAKVEHERAS